MQVFARRPATPHSNTILSLVIRGGVVLVFLYREPFAHATTWLLSLRVFPIVLDENPSYECTLSHFSSIVSRYS